MVVSAGGGAVGAESGGGAGSGSAGAGAGAGADGGAGSTAGAGCAAATAGKRQMLPATTHTPRFQRVGKTIELSVPDGLSALKPRGMDTRCCAIRRRYKRCRFRTHAEDMTPRDPRWPSDAAIDPEEHAPDASGYALVRTPPRPRRSSFRMMETVLLASTAALLAAVAWPIATGGNAATPIPAAAVVPPAAVAHAPKIQLALLLDTSSSMDGLLDQARSQLWAVVNALDSATFQGDAPRLEIAIYEYGNDELAESDGYIRQVVGFSSELDLVSEGLFELTTAGGDEFAGQVISAATQELRWDDAENVLRVIYIAGNEEFTQGATDFHESVAAARSRGIVVNTVNCTGRGDWDAGWQDAARLGGGKALRIDHNAKQAYIASPYDDEIETLSSRLNQTYIGFGERARAALDNQVRQDKNSASAGRSSSIARALSKTSGMYNNAKWDLVDALDEGTVELSTLDRSTLLDGDSELSDEELERKVKEARDARDELKGDLRALQEKREAHVVSVRSEDGQRLDNAIIDSISAQARAAGFTL